MVQWAVVVSGLLAIAPLAQAADPDHLRQLLATRRCPGCDLRGAGLVYADLSGAELTGADLRGANLSRANLTAATLKNVDFRGAVLFGANLTAADLQGANLGSVNLQEAIVTGVNFTGANLDHATVVGAVALPSSIAGARDRFNWGVREAQRQNFPGAIAYYNQAIEIEPGFSEAYLNRAVARSNLADYAGALADGQQAADLFAQKNDEPGRSSAQAFHDQLKDYVEESAKRQRGGGGAGIGIFNFLRTIGSIIVPLL